MKPLTYEMALSLLRDTFDIVRAGNDGPYLAENTLTALGINTEDDQ